MVVMGINTDCGKAREVAFLLGGYEAEFGGEQPWSPRALDALIHVMSGWLIQGTKVNAV